LEAPHKRRNAGLRFRVVRIDGHEHADPSHPLALLRAHRERPRRRAAEQRDELAASQLIELHLVPVSQGRITRYRTGGG
jgi:hypothetical protein